MLRTVFGAVLREERLAQGRTLAAVARRSGISLPYLSEIERGRKEPSSEILADLCGALDLTVPDLLARSLRTVTTRAVPTAPSSVQLRLAA
ncbi:helix-turn-helix domain-containing protein [Kineococcus gynurae]|uniref:Helix-turn-helix domain-containing protein n=1 Tax=Kineococcus gynurae TaxID=452979 RepID=A0ABV5LPW7_9ACTN